MSDEPMIDKLERLEREEWVAVDVLATGGGASWCSGCYTLEAEGHAGMEGEPPHGPDCWCDNPVWMLRSDAVRRGVVPNDDTFALPSLLSQLREQRDRTSFWETLHDERVESLEAERDTWRQRAEEAEEVVTGVVEDRDAYANALFAAERTVREQTEALEHIANPLVLDAEAQTWIAQHALDGEG